MGKYHEMWYTICAQYKNIQMSSKLIFLKRLGGGGGREEKGMLYGLLVSFLTRRKAAEFKTKKGTDTVCHEPWHFLIFLGDNKVHFTHLPYTSR